MILCLAILVEGKRHQRFHCLPVNLVNHPSQTKELVMSPADRIHEQNEQDPGRVVHTRQEAGPSDFLAADPALRIIQLNMEGLSAAKRFIIRDISERHSVNVICLQETHVDID